MSIITKFKTDLKNIINITDQIDTDAAAANIRSNIYFKGPNVWILAFSIVIASVGLNVNSAAVIIGAMLISPLMGPIIGIGLGMGTNDTALIKVGLKNLFIMVIISVLASLIFFLISPLELVNPTELEARTNPTIYDVLIALFGGFAGIFEISRKEKGTALSGVAIATALMPPLCTAGYGLAHWNWPFFLGALFLFFINGVFIILATYFSTKYMHYKEVEFQNPANSKKTKRLISLVVVLIMIPSIWSAVIMIRDNRLQKQVMTLVTENKTLTSGYIYDYKINHKKGGKITLYTTGGCLTSVDKEHLISAAEKLGIDSECLNFVQHEYNDEKNEATEKLIKGIYERSDDEISKREREIEQLQNTIDQMKKQQIPYLQVYQEINIQYPEIKDMYITRGAHVQADSISRKGVVIFLDSEEEISEQKIRSLTDWLKIRLNDPSATVINVKNLIKQMD